MPRRRISISGSIRGWWRCCSGVPLFLGLNQLALYLNMRYRINLAFAKSNDRVKDVSFRVFVPYVLKVFILLFIFNLALW